jgi:hypothetical protein
MFGAMAENLSGEYVTHADHLATLAAKDAEWQTVLAQSIETSNANVAAAQDEIATLKNQCDQLRLMFVLVDAELPEDFEPDLGQIERVDAFAKSYAALREQIAKLTAPVSDEEVFQHRSHATNGGYGHKDGLLNRTAIDALFKARAKAADAVKEQP